ncbi:hypothetical protein EGW08_021472, partial [Elysia chlorotica]
MRKNQRRAQYEEADACRQTKDTAEQFQGGQRARAEPQTPKAEKTPSPQAGKPRKTCPSDEYPRHAADIPNGRDSGPGPVANQKKLNKKQRKREEKKKEQELQEIREEIERKEREKKERLERKRKEQGEKERIEREKREEKERKEREKREEEERCIREIQEAEEKRQREERRLWQEMEEKKCQERLRRERERLEKEREQKEEEERIKAFMDDFDAATLIDDNGEFKVTDPNIINLIRRDDLNALGNACSSQPNGPVEYINGFRTEDYIRLQGATEQAKTTQGHNSSLRPPKPGHSFSEALRNSQHKQLSPGGEEMAAPHEGQGARPKTTWGRAENHAGTIGDGSGRQHSRPQPEQQYQYNCWQFQQYHPVPQAQPTQPVNTMHYVPSWNQAPCPWYGPTYQSMHSTYVPLDDFYGPSLTPIQPMHYRAFPRRGRPQYNTGSHQN